MIAVLSTGEAILLIAGLLSIPIVLGLVLGLYLRRRLNQARAARAEGQATETWAGKVVDFDTAMKTGNLGKNLSNDAKHRISGVVCLAGALFFTSMSIIEPLQAAERHDSAVTLWPKSVVVIPLMFALGVILLARGEKAPRLMGNGQRTTAFGVALVVGGLIGGIVLYECLKRWLGVYGYAF